MIGQPPEEFEILTRDQAEAAGAQVLALHLQIKTAEGKANRVAFAAQKLTTRISELKGRLGRYEEALKKWATDNRTQMGDQKSMVMRHITIAFRNSRPAVRFLEGWTLPAILARLRKSEKLKTYIRVKEELDRQRILSDARPEVARLDIKTMRGFGVEIASEEHFYIEPKLEAGQ